MFLLDCCAGASATTTSQNVVGTKETIAACGFEAQAPEPGGHSFTCELIEVLDKWKSKAPFSVAMLHSELLANLRHPKPKKDMFGKLVESRRTPVYVVTTSNAKAISIALARRHSEPANCSDDSRPRKRQRISLNPVFTNEEDSEDLESPAATPPTSDSSADDARPKEPDTEKYKQDQLNRVLSEGDLNIPHVLISLALEGEQLLEIGAWNKWLSDCPSFAKYARIEGMYKSHSTLLILSVPVIIWDLLPDNQACSFIGYVNSTNRVSGRTWQDEEDLKSWLSNMEGWENNRGNLSREVSASHTDMPWERSSRSMPRARSASPMAMRGSLPLQSHAPLPERTPQYPPIARHKVPRIDTSSDLPDREADINSLLPHPTPAPDKVLGSPLSPEPKLERSSADHAQLPMNTPQYTMSLQSPFTSIRPSSGVWNPQDDQTLMAVRAQGMNWAPIQQAYFPSKTPNACRKRHERLMEERNANDWDGLKLETLAKNYMCMRREIWLGLATETSEKWNIVEQKVLVRSYPF